MTQEIENKIVAICLKCPHAKFVTGHYECQVARRHCHSNRVGRWLKELEGSLPHKVEKIKRT